MAGEKQLKFKMGWSHPDISLEDLLTLIKGFVDILILASGYQSTGGFAHWDSQTIKQAFQWGSFFENVISRLSCSDDQQDSLKELDDALSKMKSNPHFPQGLAQLSSTTLGRGRNFVVEHLVRALPLRDAHLRAVMTGAIEMDLDDIRRTESDYLNLYLDELMLMSAPSEQEKRSYVQESRTSYPEVVPNGTPDHGTDGNCTMLSIQELMRRQLAVSRILSVESGLGLLSKTLTQNKWSEVTDIFVTENLKLSSGLVHEEQLISSDTWNSWRTKNISYLLDKRTIRLVSGASMIFSAPKAQWLEVLERLYSSAEASDDTLCETIELLLFGCAAGRWSTLVDHFMSVSYNSHSIRRMYGEMQNLLLQRYPNKSFNNDFTNLKVQGVLEHLEALLSNQLHQLWKLSPILAAIAIPFWSQLFKLYLSELESQFKEESSTIRCCKDRKEHKDCVVAVRIWCLYIFHVQGSHTMNDAASI